MPPKIPLNYTSSDGVKFPSAANPKRKEWEQSYLSALKTYYGDEDWEYEETTLPVEGLHASHAVFDNTPRTQLYSRMFSQGTQPHHVLVHQNPDTGHFHILDGNRTVEAARQSKVKSVKVYIRRPKVQQIAPKLRKDEENYTDLPPHIQKRVEAVRSVLTDADRKPEYRGHPNPMHGHCYLAAQTCFHLFGGKDAGWKPHFVNHNGARHWFLKHATGLIVDPTADQFDEPVDYAAGVGKGFLTAEPDKRTMAVLDRIHYSLKKTEDLEDLDKSMIGAIAAGMLALAQDGSIHKDLHPHLKAISQLESSGGKNVQHAAHSKGNYHTAVGAVGLKPITAHETYKKDQGLQQQFPNLQDPAKFTNELQTNPTLYNSVANTHWGKLLKWMKGDAAKSSYAWRWGVGAARNATPEKIQKDTYVSKFLKLIKPKEVVKKGELATLDNLEDLSKAEEELTEQQMIEQILDSDQPGTLVVRLHGWEERASSRVLHAALDRASKESDSGNSYDAIDLVDAVLTHSNRDLFVWKRVWDEGWKNSRVLANTLPNIKATPEEVKDLFNNLKERPKGSDDYTNEPVQYAKRRLLTHESSGLVVDKLVEDPKDWNLWDGLVKSPALTTKHLDKALESRYGIGLIATILERGRLNGYGDQALTPDILQKMWDKMHDPNSPFKEDWQLSPELAESLARSSKTPAKILSHMFNDPQWENHNALRERLIRNENTPEADIAKRLDDPAFERAYSSYIVKRENLSPELLHRIANSHINQDDTLESIATHPNTHLDTLRLIAEKGSRYVKPLAQERLQLHSPDDFHQEKVGVKFDSHKFRAARDHIQASGKLDLSPKQMPPGNWGMARLPNGNISADKLQQHIDSLPTKEYNVSHGEWNGAQRHNDEPSSVFQLNLTNGLVDEMKKEGVYGTFRDMHEASMQSGHPITLSTIGWVRYTGEASENTEGKRDKFKKRYISRLQAFVDRWRDNIQNVYRNRAAEARDALVDSGDERHKPLASILRPRERDSYYNFFRAADIAGISTPEIERFREAYGYTNELNAFLSTDGRSHKDLPHDAVKWVQENVNPAFGNDLPQPPAETEENRGIHIDEVQSDFGQSFVRQAAQQARENGQDEENAASEAQKKWPDDHFHKIKKILFGDKHPNEVLHEAFQQHLRDKGHAGTPIATWQPESKAPISGWSLDKPLPVHAQITYREVPQKKFGWKEAKYGDIPVQDNKNHQATPVDGVNDLPGAKTYQGVVRKHLLDHLEKSEDVHHCVKCGKKVKLQEDGKIEPHERIRGARMVQCTGERTVQLEKAISDLKPGRLISQNPQNGATLWDYSHLLSPQHRSAGYQLHVHQGGTKLYGKTPKDLFPSVELKHLGKDVGGLSAKVTGPAMKITISDVEEEHRGKGLGQKMYEASYAHAFHRMGVNTIHGDAHSSMASRVHQKLAAKHGLEYQPQPNKGLGADQLRPDEWDRTEEGPYDFRYSPYSFTLKGEVDPHDPSAKKAVAVLVTKPGYFLMGKRRDSGKWCCVGGHVEMGENLHHAAIRETMEETGLVPTVLYPIGAGNGGPDGRIAVHMYRAHVKGEPTNEHDPDKEYAEFRWCSDYEHLPQDMQLHHSPDLLMRELGLTPVPMPGIVDKGVENVGT